MSTTPEVKKSVTGIANLIFALNDSLIVGVPHHWRETGGAFGFWSVRDGAKVHFVQLGNGQWIDLIGASHDGRLLTTYVRSTDDSSFLGCYSVMGNKWLWRKNNRDYVYGLAFSENDSEIITVRERAVERISSLTGEITNSDLSLLSNYDQRSNRRRRVVFAPSGRYLAIWHEQYREYPAPLGKLLRGRENQQVTVWDDVTKRSVVVLEIDDTSRVLSAIFTPDESTMILSVDATMWLWSLKGNQVVRKIETGQGSSFMRATAAFLASDCRINTGERTGVRIWSIPEFKVVEDIPHVMLNFDHGTPIAFTSKGKYFAVGQQEGQLRLYETVTWKELWNVDTSPEDTLNH